MQYFFILGNNPDLSIAELSSLFDLNKDEYFLLDNVFILKTNTEIDEKKLIKKIGGTIKLGRILDESLKFYDHKKIKEKIIEIASKKEKQGKFKFGFSYYGNKKLNIRQLGMKTKKHLREQNISCRWVISKEKTLSSVVVEQNKLHTKGLEIVLIENNNKLLIGETTAVQPFKELSFRDYGRPARDDHSGMLPPKLAQIMINLAQTEKKQTLLDPFCGSGTVLTEAMLMDFENLIGTDISKKAIQDSEKNINWTQKKNNLSTNYKLINISATEISKQIKSESINCIVTEPYLGPQRGKHDIKKTIKELENLYNHSLKEFKKILKNNGKIVMIWPIFRNKKYSQHLNLNLNVFKITNHLPKKLLSNKNLKISNRNTIIYGREGQKVWREIVILTKTA